MSSKNSKILKTFNVKKDKKLQAKKRKLEAFLNLVRKDEEETSLQNKTSKGSFAESYKALKDELKKYQKKDAIEPSFYLTQDGRNALVKFSSNDENIKFASPLFVEDIYHLLLRCLLGNLSPFPIRWAKLEIPQNISKTVLFHIEGLSLKDVVDINTELNQNSEMFPYVFGIVSSNIPFATELSTLHLASDFYSHAKENYSSLFPVENCTIDVEKSSKQGNTISRLHLLLSPIQLAMESYPLPKSAFEQSRSEDYVFTKESYTPVTANSPMFALDCEMCKVVSGRHEVTRIAIVNENLETVYHTLVKPKEKITDYMTRYSGVTEKMLEKVQTTLKDVHSELRKFLPNDAILCGQSLNCDLNALKMIHPYVIDTSVIYNQFGVRQRKTSLKQLARIHLKEAIQDNKRGHNPIEDSIATMKLVQLKLKNCIQYGDAVLSSDFMEDAEDQDTSVSKESPNFSDFVNLNTGFQQDGFFSLITKFSSKKVCVIGSEDILNNYHPNMLSDNVTKIEKSSVKKIVKTTSANLNNYDLIMSHLAFEAENNSVADINEGLKQAYESCPNKAVFLVILSGFKMSQENNFKHSLCMAVLKKSTA